MAVQSLPSSMQLSEIKIEKPIVNGGQKQVFLGSHPTLGSVVYKTGKVRSISSLERIHREISLLRSIQVDSFPKNYLFEWDTSRLEFHIVEELIDGDTLEARMDLPWDEKEILSFLREIAVALEQLWSRHVVHRDLKPQNIMFRKDMSVVVIDLGIARFLDLVSLTDTLNLMGPCTPLYAAPEQLRNEKQLVDTRTDLFALGTIVLQLALGFHPFDPDHVGNSRSVVENILSGDFVGPEFRSDLSAAFCKVVRRLLKPRQFQRFRNGIQLTSFLDRQLGE